HIPVVLVTALNQPAGRLRGLNAGADDFLTKPVDPVALLARVRSISKLRLSLDELRSRALRLAKLGIGDPFAEALADDGSGGRIMLVEDCPSTAAIIKDALRRHHIITAGRDWGRALDPCEARRFDLFIVSLDLACYDGLRYCARLRSQAEILQTPVLVDRI
ncbi:MAG: PleD family two-component system response regulator, partial [Methylocella sp.]